MAAKRRRAPILGAVQATGASVHVQRWGDRPFVESSGIDRVVARLLASDSDFVGKGFITGRLLPYRLDVIALRVPALERAEPETRDNPYHREHAIVVLSQRTSAVRVLSEVRRPPNQIDTS